MLSLRQGDLSRASPARTEPWASVTKQTFDPYFPWMAAAARRGMCLGGRGADAVSLLTQGIEQAAAMWKWELSGALYPFPGEAQLLAGRLEEAPSPNGLALTREHQGAGIRRMPCTSSVTLRHGASL